MEEFVMEFLNIEPLLAALKMKPAEFVKDGCWIRHLPSNHRFKVDDDANVKIDASCDCALLHVRREQAQQLLHVLEIWESAYWRPLEINKEFAAHFRAQGRCGQAWRTLKLTFAAQLSSSTIEPRTVTCGANNGNRLN